VSSEPLSFSDMIITRRETRVIAASFPERIAISYGLLADADPKYLTIEIAPGGNLLFILDLDNGRAVYTAVEFDQKDAVFICKRISHEQPT
jgi:hypothetical protein